MDETGAPPERGIVNTGWPQVVIVAVALSAFGPYLAAGIRTDQPVVYGLALSAIFVALLRKRYRLGVHAVVLTCWSLTVVFGALTSLTAPHFRRGGEIAMLDNLLLPVAVSLAVSMAISPENRARLWALFSVTFVGCMVVNSVVVLTQMATGSIGSVSAWLPVGGGSAAERVETTGRFMGIFQSPAVSGVVYSIALVVAIWLLRKRPLLLWITIPLLIVAGIGSVSKSFIFIGVPVGMLYLMYASRRLGIWLVLTLAVVTFTIWLFATEIWAWISKTFPDWSGGERLVEVVFADLSLEGLTANRYGEYSTIRPVLEAVLAESPVSGFGLSGVGSALDSAWILALAIGGTIGTLGLLGVFTGLLYALYSRRFELPNDELVMFGAIVLILLGTSVGAPALTMNRLSVIVWTIIAFICCGRVAHAPARKGMPWAPAVLPRL